ncbi:MAG: zinc-ribbon domain-containing protein [Saccharofermentanales bacterium]|nr:zinc-ribbon domain-containing protein [Eubacteriales bacterium]MDD3611104.1 zinc-ribbon domain-containing protein [Eubacteriales bacterium]HHU03533.1 zinc-ribbon domain-containing protein [Fastidiosipila sp.]
MRCESCGEVLPDGTRYCTNCGAEVSPIAEQGEGQSGQYNYPPEQQYYPQPVMDAPLTVGQYIGMFLLMLIPLVNLILLLVWAFNSSGNINRRNFARAALIMMLIGLVISIILTIAFGSLFLAFWRGNFPWDNGNWWEGMMQFMG